MDAAFVPHAALFDRAIKDVGAGVDAKLLRHQGHDRGMGWIRDSCYLCWNLTLCQRVEVHSHCSLIIVILSGLCYLYNVIVFEDK